MRCDAVELSISQSLDGDGRVDGVEAAHLRTCRRCGAFADGAQRLRRAVRLIPAPDVPDLVPDVMAAVREDLSSRSLRGTPGPVQRPRSGRHPSVILRAVAAALVLGLVAGFAVTRSGLVPLEGPEPALASSVPSALVRAATGLRGYRATFGVTERDWSPRVRTRTFVATIAYRAPESLRITVTDTTRYPTGAAARNDLSLVTDGNAWQSRGPAACAARGVCRGAGDRTIVRRPPFDRQSGLPTDLIVPMTVLAAQRRVPVTGTGTVAGHPAVRVDVPFEQTESLLQALEFAGSWRPFYAQDAATLWLDRSTWLPLRYEIRPAPGPERAMWAARNGLPHEPAALPVFVASMRSLSTVVPPAADFRSSQAPSLNDPAVDEGFQSLPFPSAPGWLRPADVAGLAPFRYGRFVRTSERPYRQEVTAYARGLTWLTVTRITGWNRARLFGAGGFAQAVGLPGGGTGYYEPATGPVGGDASDARRVALHTRSGEFLVTSNLPPDDLLRVAGSLPARGQPEPAGWRIHRWRGGELIQGLSPAEAVRMAPFPARLPAAVGDGYAPVAAEVSRIGAGTTITVAFRRTAADPAGTGLWLSETAATVLPPPTDPVEEQVAVLGALGRWSPNRHLLEWVAGGVYHSLSAGDLDLSTLLRIARTMRAPEQAP